VFSLYLVSLGTDPWNLCVEPFYVLSLIGEGWFQVQ
jgi:hypothetical protein